MAVNFDAVLRLTAKVGGLQEVDKLKGALGSVEGIARNARTAFTNVTSSATWQAAAVGAAAIGAGLVSSIRVAMDFEKAMSGVQAKVGGTSAEIAELNKLARDLGRTTQFSAKEAAEGMDFLAMAGFKANEIVAAMPGLLNLAAAGNLELGTAADIASNILGGLNMEASETVRVADVLAKAATSSNVSVEMLGETFKMVAPVAAQAGVSLEELAAATGLLGDAGIQGSEAGTGLRSVLLRLAAPPAEAAKALDRLGISTKDTSGNMRPFGEILAEVDQRMNELNLGTGEQIQIQNALYGKTAIASGAILQQAAATGKLEEKTKELMGSQGAAAEMATIMNDNLAGAFKRLQSAIEGFQIQLMSGTNPAVRVFVDSVAVAINVVTDMMERFPILTGAVVALAAAFVALVALAPFIAAFISIIGSIKVALAGVGFATIVAGWQTVAIVAFAAIKTAIAGFLAWVGATVVPALLAFFSGPVGWTILAVAAVVAMVIAFREPILQFFAWLGGAIANGLNALWKWGEPIRQFWVGAWDAVKGVVTGFFGWFGTAITDGIKSLWAIGEPIRKFWADTWEGVKQYATAYFTWLGGVVRWGMETSLAILYAVFIQPWVNIWNNVLRGPVTAALDWIQGAWRGFVSFFTANVVGPISGAWEKFTQLLRTAMDRAINAVRSVWNGVASFFTANVVVPIQLAWEGLTRVLSSAMQTAISAVQGIWNGIGNAFNQYVVQPISGAWNALIELLPNAMGKAAEFVKGVWTGLVESIKSVVTNMLQFVVGAINRVVSMINTVISASNKVLGSNIQPMPTMQVPEFAKGGRVIGPTLALVGEGGEPEYIIPESKMAQSASNYLNGSRGNAVIPAFASGGVVGPAFAYSDTMPNAMLQSRLAANALVQTLQQLASVQGKLKLSDLSNNLVNASRSAKNLAGSIVNLALAYQKLPTTSSSNTPKFAKGGVVDKATLAMIGEGGEREYIVPESKMAAASSRYLGGARGSAVIPGSSGSGGGQQPVVNITTGPVMEMQGERYITVGDLQTAVQETANQIYSTLRTPGGRRAIGVA